jgi:hypothetical protein
MPMLVDDPRPSYIMGPNVLPITPDQIKIKMMELGQELDWEDSLELYVYMHYTNGVTWPRVLAYYAGVKCRGGRGING